MARTAINAQNVVGPYPATPVTANALDVTLTACDAANGNSTPFGSASKLLLVAQNTGAGARTITLSSIEDSLNRKGDITTYSIGAGEFMAFLFERSGWLQSDGSVYYTGEHAEVEVVVFAI